MFLKLKISFTLFNRKAYLTPLWYSQNVSERETFMSTKSAILQTYHFQVLSTTSLEIFSTV